MKIVLDTNILLQSIAHASRLRPIWNAFLNEQLELFVTSAILLEYEEKLTEKTSKQVAQNIISLISEAPNANFISVYYEWNTIIADYDDNKFFDAAVAANADYLITNDAHFNQVKALTFPKVIIVTADEFLKVLQL
jgi:putative PIN family toxin of toxin-antitoxin system